MTNMFCMWPWMWPVILAAKWIREVSRPKGSTTMAMVVWLCVNMVRHCSASKLRRSTQKPWLGHVKKVKTYFLWSRLKTDWKSTANSDSQFDMEIDNDWVDFNPPIADSILDGTHAIDLSHAGGEILELVKDDMKTSTWVLIFVNHCPPDIKGCLVGAETKMWVINKIKLSVGFQALLLKWMPLYNLTSIGVVE